MNSDFRISVGFPDHPKTRKLVATLGPAGFMGLVTLWSYIARYHPDGIIKSDEIELGAGWQGEPGSLVNALKRCGFLDGIRGGSGGQRFAIHGWSERNGYASFAERRSESARQAANIRWERQHAGAMRSHNERNAPSPVPSPSPVPEQLQHPPTPLKGGPESPDGDNSNSNGEQPSQPYRPRPRRERGDFERLSETAHERVARRGEPCSTVLAKLAGQQAGLRGEPPEANKYPEGSQEAQLWEKGRSEALMEH